MSCVRRSVLGPSVTTSCITAAVRVDCNEIDSASLRSVGVILSAGRVASSS